MVQQNMKLNNGTKQINIDISCKQIITIKNLAEFINVSLIRGFYASTNYLKRIEDIILTVNNINELDLSINHIETIENLHKAVNLIYLNLANNRIKQIKGLEGLVSLEILVR